MFLYILKKYVNAFVFNGSLLDRYGEAQNLLLGPRPLVYDGIL